MATSNFNLSTFRKRVHSIARTQYFVVRIPQVGDAEIITALARSTTIPSMVHDTLDVWYRGLSMKIDGRPTYAPWSVTFLCDEAHSLRNVFLKWMEKAYNVQTLRNFGHNDYKQDGLSVSQLAADKRITASVIFHGAFPSNVGEITLTQAEANVEEFTVEFTYDYYVMNDKDGDAKTTNRDILVSDQGVYSGVTIKGIGGVTLNLNVGT
jgi:hypothetical protein